MQNRHRYLVAATLLVILMALGSALVHSSVVAGQVYPPPGSPTPSVPDIPIIRLPLISLSPKPPVSTSYYLRNLTTLYSLGYALGQHDYYTNGKQDNLVILDYGYPSVLNGVYGVKLTFDDVGVFHPISEIISSANDFANGYYDGVGNDYESHLTLVIGVNSCCNENTLSFFRSHGDSWGQVVNEIIAFLTSLNQSHDQFDSVGGMDIEMGWNHPYRIAQWVDYYKSSTNCVPVGNDSVEGCFYNFGTMSVSASGTTCASADSQTEWHGCDVWYVSWGTQKNGRYFARPLPEIYHGAETLPPWGTDATAWKDLSLFSANQMGSGKMYFVGTLTQRARCDNDCGWGNNYPWQGYKLLTDALASNPITAMNLRWSTDISNQLP